MPPSTLAAYARYADRADCSPQDEPVVSVVTVALNAERTIERTIRSVQAQSFSPIEHVFVDGGSNDETLATIRRLARPQDRWISEKDSGISDGFNKGVALSRGRSILILNADDWLSEDQIACAVMALERSGADFVFGDVIFHEGGAPSFHYAGDSNYAHVIHRRWPSVGHPTLLATRGCFERIGLFDPAYRNAMDYDWLLRLHRAGGRGVYCPGIFAHMTHEGVSNREFVRTIEEVRRIVIADGRHPLIAGLEARMRRLKTGIAQPAKRHMRPLYGWVRRRINPSYRPIPEAMKSVPATEFQ